MKAEWLHHLSNYLRVPTFTRLTPTLEEGEVGVQSFDKCAGVSQSNDRRLTLIGREWVVVIATGEKACLEKPHSSPQPVSALERRAREG